MTTSKQPAPDGAEPVPSAPLAPAGRLSVPVQRPLAAILWMLLTTALFVSMDTLAKTLTASLPTGEVVWGRFIFHALFLAVFLNRRLVVVMHSRRPGLQLVRSAFLLMTTLCFFNGLRLLDLATNTAIMFMTPLLVTLLSVPVLREPVGWRRILSVMIGFVGALIIIRPGSEAIGLAALLPLGAALFNSAYQLSTRVLAHVDSPLTTLSYTAVIGALFSNLMLLEGWVTPSPIEWLKLMAVGLLGCLSHFSLIKAFSLANAAVAAPFTYSSLIWATLFGALVFGELPDLWTVVGALVIVGSGLYILYRERARRAAAPAK